MGLIDNGGYKFWDDNFSTQSAYEDCKAVFDGITDDDSFQECDTGIILYHAHEILYALKAVASSPERKTGKWIVGDYDTVRGYWATCSSCGHISFGGGKFCRECGAKMNSKEVHNG